MNYLTNPCWALESGYIGDNNDRLVILKYVLRRDFVTLERKI